MERTLATALAQDGADIEVIVVDDGSTDDTADWLEAHPDPRVRLVRHAVARGVAQARNAGNAGSSGRWIAFLDDDDLWAPAKLAAQLVASRRTGASFSYTAAVRVDGDLRPRAPMKAPRPENLLRELMSANVVPAGQASVMVRRSLMDDVGGFDARLSMLADWDMWIRLAVAGSPAACDDVLVAYVVHPGSMSVSRTAVSRREIAILREKHGTLARSLGCAIGDERFWQWMIWGHRGSGRRLATARIYAEKAFMFRRGSDLARAGAALIGRPFMDLGPAWSMRSDPGAETPDWLARLQSARTVVG
jgi:glycosyltransferase involved in cell wall biosynthesis